MGESEELLENTVSIAWKDVRVSTNAGRLLLNGINGVAMPGEVVALMGASGAGKSTLLNTLLHRNLRGLSIEGKIMVNGQEVGAGVTSVSCYVQQEDLFIGRLTVGEHLRMQARLRLPSSVSAEDREQRVAEVLRDMMLEGSQSSRIGVPGIIKGISGGEMKRLAFATEMLNNPPVLFCDEPTTGLDSYMAMMIVKRLETLAALYGKTIVCTIHQPASEVFELFDKVLFLAQGRVAFCGSPFEAVLFFGDCNYPVPDHTNPADHFIDTLAIWAGKVDECKTKCNEICDRFETSEYYKRMMKIVEDEEDPRMLVPHKGASFLTLIFVLFCRYFWDNMRNPSILRAKLVQKVIVGLFAGLLYLRAADEYNQTSVLSLMGALFYFCSEVTYSTVFGIQACMPSDFPLLVREHHDGIYPIICYYIARILSYLPIFTIDGMAFVSIAYFMIGLKPYRFGQALVTMMIIEWNVISLGVAVVSIAPSYAIAVSLTGPLLTVFSMTGGIFTNVEEIPSWIKWVQYLSWFRYGYESLIINEFGEIGDGEISCTDDKGDKALGYCLDSGAKVIEKLHFEEKNMYFNWGMMLLATLIIYCIGYIGLVLRVKKAR